MGEEPLRLVVDASAAGSGGLRTYVDHLLAAWAQTFPRDRLTVVVPAGSDVATDPHTRHEFPVRRPAALQRPPAVTRAVRAAVAGADAVLATLPATTLRHPGVPLVVAAHDLRHELRPEQFTRQQRLLRRLSYDPAYRRADRLLAISERTRQDLITRHPRLDPARITVVHHGADHALAWRASASGPEHGQVEQVGQVDVAFAHHTNKNPDLVIEAWALLRDRGVRRRLRVLGVSPTLRDLLADRIEQHRLGELVELAPYLSEEEFVATLAYAGIVVFPTDFEGFGLPVLEGMLVGADVVIGPEPACREVAGGHAVEADAFTAAAIADAVQLAAARTDEQRRAAEAWASRFTWAETVRRTRDLVLAATC